MRSRHNAALRIRSRIRMGGNAMTEHRRNGMALPTLRALAVALALVVAPASAFDRTLQTPLPVPPSGVIGMQDAYFAPEFWIARTPAADQVLMTPAAIQARNARLLQVDDSMHDLSALPATLDRARVAGWIEDLASPPSKPLWDETAKPVPKATLDAIVGNRAMGAIPASQPTRFGMAVQRTAMRAFPTELRVFNRQGETDIDRFQESALFPGDPAPYRIVTGAKPHTVFTREEPRLSELQLDMGVRVPCWPIGRGQAGERPASLCVAWILDLPVRGSDGRSASRPPCCRAMPTAPGLPAADPANLIRQAFKFLGERYGWGHSYDGRDCSGFVSEVYRSMGVRVAAQHQRPVGQPGLRPHPFRKPTTASSHAPRGARCRVGDLVYIPGHVMMVIGRIDGMPWVIHDTTGGSFTRRRRQHCSAGCNSMACR
jgi:hypothetical protein